MDKIIYWDTEQDLDIHLGSYAVMNNFNKYAKLVFCHIKYVVSCELDIYL